MIVYKVYSLVLRVQSVSTLDLVGCLRDSTRYREALRAVMQGKVITTAKTP
jgi:hypothetical protein